jgi:hypothetical protein
VTWLLAVLGGLLVLVLAGLALPVRLTVVGDGRHLVARLRAFLGLVEVTLAPRARAPRAERKPRAARRRGGPLGVFLRGRGVVEVVRRAAVRLYRALHTRELSGVVRFGLDDPADTGALWGALTPVVLRLRERHPELTLQPTFEGAGLEATGRWSLEVVPLEIVWVSLRLLVSPPMLRLGWAARRTS